MYRTLMSDQAGIWITDKKYGFFASKYGFFTGLRRKQAFFCKTNPLGFASKHDIF
jgi:hypothetical protein